MNAQLLKGRDVAATITDDLKKQATHAQKNGPLCLALVQIGSFEDAKLYAKSIHRIMEKLGIAVKDIVLAERVSLNDAQTQVQLLNRDSAFSGILILSPLPKGLSHAELSKAIAPAKDVECAHAGLGLNSQALYPPTALSIFELIKASGVAIQGKEAVVVGRSAIVGRPAAKLLLDAHATVTLCHSRTQDLESHVRRADILVAAVGKPNLIKGDWIKPGAVVVDAAENVVNGKVVGDVQFDEAQKHAAYLTPVPSGVGPLTTYMLAKNLITLRSNV